MAKNEELTASNTDEDVEQEEDSSTLLVGVKISTTILENCLAASPKAKYS